MGAAGIRTPGGRGTAGGVRGTARPSRVLQRRVRAARAAGGVSPRRGSGRDWPALANRTRDHLWRVLRLAAAPDQRRGLPRDAREAPDTATAGRRHGAHERGELRRTDERAHGTSLHLAPVGSGARREGRYAAGAGQAGQATLQHGPTVGANGNTDPPGAGAGAVAREARHHPRSARRGDGAQGDTAHGRRNHARCAMETPCQHRHRHPAPRPQQPESTWHRTTTTTSLGVWAETPRRSAAAGSRSASRRERSTLVHAEADAVGRTPGNPGRGAHRSRAGERADILRGKLERAREAACARRRGHDRGRRGGPHGSGDGGEPARTRAGRGHPGRMDQREPRSRQRPSRSGSEALTPKFAVRRETVGQDAARLLRDHRYRRIEVDPGRGRPEYPEDESRPARSHKNTTTGPMPEAQ